MGWSVKFSTTFLFKVCLHILLFSHRMDTHLKFMANLRPNFKAKHKFKTEDSRQRLVDSRGPARLQAETELAHGVTYCRSINDSSFIWYDLQGARVTVAAAERL